MITGKINSIKQIKENGGIYQIYRVYNIGKEPQVVIYDDLEIFSFEEVLYRVEVK